MRTKSAFCLPVDTNSTTSGNLYNSRCHVLTTDNGRFELFVDNMAPPTRCRFSKTMDFVAKVVYLRSNESRLALYGNGSIT